MWYQKIIQIFKIKDLRGKILFILAIFVIFRLMANIPFPGVDIENMRKFFGQFQALGMLNVFTGGTLEKFSIIMLGVGPYIIATVILQLLTMVFPQLKEMYKEGGEEGRHKFEQYGRLLTVPLAALQAFGMLTLFSKQDIIGQLSPIAQLSAIMTITAGTMLLMWLGELISEKGMGNGISLLIFAGIIAEFPKNISQMLSAYTPSMLPSYFIFFVMALIIVAGVILVNEARRNIPVSYAKRVRGMRVYGGVSTYLPMSVNPAGVMPIIFALAILTFPSMLAGFLSGAGGFLGKAAQNMGNFFNQGWVNGIFYFILVYLFTYFYTLITFEPKSISENIQKMGGFIPGIRPGESTSKFLTYVLNRILPIGALFLGLIALMPSVLQNLTRVISFSFLVGGTSLLIIVSVVLETMRQVKAQLEMREYESF